MRVIQVMFRILNVEQLFAEMGSKNEMKCVMNEAQMDNQTIVIPIVMDMSHQCLLFV